MKIISNNEYSPYLVRVSNSEFSDINTSNQDKKVIPKDNTEDISVDYKKLNAYTRQLMNIRNHASKEVNNAITTESHNKAKVYKNIVNSINILLEKNNHDPYPHGHKPDWIDDIDIKTITDTYANNILINLIKNMENINYKRINKQIKETYKAYAQNIVEWMKN